MEYPQKRFQLTTFVATLQIFISTGWDMAREKIPAELIEKMRDQPFFTRVSLAIYKYL